MSSAKLAEEEGESSCCGDPQRANEWRLAPLRRQSKKAMSEPVVTVDATKVAEEKEEEADVEVAEAVGTKRSLRGGEEKEEGELSLWADVGGEETL